MITVDGLPASIRVGPYDIKIKQVARINKADDYGQFHLDEQTITLRKRYKTAPLAVGTLIHEVLHGAWRSMELPDKCDEEQAVSALSTCLTQIFRDNPQLTAWIQSTLAK